MGIYESLRIRGFDHIEFAVGDLEKASELYVRMGFERVATREIRERQLRSVLMSQNQLWILLSQSTLASDPIAQFVNKHGDGVYSVALACDDVLSAFEQVVQKGARVADGPKAISRDFGVVHQASIRAFGSVRHSFISRQGLFFAEGFDVPVRSQSRGFGLESIDHVTCNIERGQLDKWGNFYESVFGLQTTRTFDLHSGQTALSSRVLESPDRKIKFPLNEPDQGSNQVQDFIDVNHGPGVQHVALTSSEITSSLKALQREKVRFIKVPERYYAAVQARVPSLGNSISELKELGVLVDGNEDGYLLHAYTEHVVGAFFYEVLQRKDYSGFGEGGFQSYLDALDEVN